MTTHVPRIVARTDTDWARARAPGGRNQRRGRPLIVLNGFCEATTAKAKSIITVTVHSRTDVSTLEIEETAN